VPRNRVYQALNVDEEITKRTETTKARRCAAAKANAAKRAKKAAK
jgi:hypothetical protein